MGHLTEYAELKARTHYSFLQGASHPHELVERARELGLSAIGVCDRNGVYGMPKAYRAIQEMGSNGTLRLLTGAEIDFQDGARLTVLAQTRLGYGLLCRLLTRAHADQPKGKAALHWSDWWGLCSRFPQAAQEILLLPEWDSTLDRKIKPPDWERLCATFSAHDQISLPLTRLLDGRDHLRTQQVQLISQQTQIPLVATTDAVMHRRARKRLHDLQTAIRARQPLSAMGFALQSNAERVLKSPQEMAELFSDLPQALTRTLDWAQRCTFSPSELRYRYPAEWIPAGETALSYLRKQVEIGAKTRYPQGTPTAVQKQLEHELALIAQLEFADYFLTIWEIVVFARSQQILCQGRGAAANSIVCYCLGITAIDPVKMDLLFERFISVERGEPPDIDVDFEHERREEVIQHVYSKYGRDRAAMVAAVITYRSRSCLRDITKAAGLTPQEASQSELWKSQIQELKGFPRHLSIHSGGFTLSADPIIETVPVEPARMEGRTIIQWDKDDLDYIGLLKVDLLALGMLSALRKTLDSVNQARTLRNQPLLDLATLPANDPPTYAMIQRADTVGVFQIESRAQMNMLKRLRPQNYYDLVVQVAIVRPGPIVGKMVHPYLKRRRGQESSASPDPRLEPILSRTLGVPLFQEQVMKMAITLAGFTPGEADQLRRAIGAWRSSGNIEKWGRKLQEGLLREGLPQEFVDRVFLQIQGFSEYGFPESHAASFALLAYASSYLKCHYPAEFLCALLNSQPMGFYSNSTLINEAMRAGVQVRSLDINAAHWESTVTSNPLGHSAVQIGFHTLNGFSKRHYQPLAAERAQHGPFRNLEDFLARTQLPIRHLSSLAMGGVFASWGLEPRDALWRILAARVQVQDDLFHSARVLPVLEQPQPPWPKLSPFEQVQAQFRSFGYSTQTHPMAALRQQAVVPPQTAHSQQVRNAPGSARIQLAGLVICRQRPQTAQGVVFATLEDEWGFMDLLFREPIYVRYAEIIRENPLLLITGRVQRDGTTIQIIAENVKPLLQTEIRSFSHDFH